MKSMNTMERLRDMETPYFLINESELKANIEQLQAALHTHWGKSIIAYSFKANALPWLLSYFRDLGLYAEVVSEDEYQLALAMGYDKGRIVYNGQCKTKETFLDALKNGSVVNVDSERELLWLKETGCQQTEKYDIGIRVNFDLEKHCPGESTMGIEGSRFGFCYENGELKRAIEFIGQINHVNLVGLHLHCNSKTRSLNIYRAISKIACEIAEAWSLNLKYVDVGGGFYGGLIDKPQFNDYLAVISGELSKTFDQNKTLLIVEPGTSLVSSPFYYITRVIDTKQTTANTFIVTDGSRIHIDPLMNKTIYFFDIKHNPNFQGEMMEKQVVSGFTCMEFDRLFELLNHPKLAVGDQIIYSKVGAYTMCLSPLFIQYFPPVYVIKGENLILVRKKAMARDYLDINQSAQPAVGNVILESEDSTDHGPV